MPSSSASDNLFRNGNRRRPRPENNICDDEPPFWILDEVLNLLRAKCDTDWNLEEITRAKSAQQQVFVLRFSNQNVSSNSQEENNDWTTAMNCGKKRLVLRIWKGGSRWWNLNRNESPLELARAEIMGYRVARNALEIHRSSVSSSNEQNDSADADTTSWVPKIPRVMHFSEAVKSSSLPCCWAILEYVGADEDNFLATTFFTMKIDRSYLHGMIKIREEFGFEEPHPRWGRVPVEEALDYAQSIATQVLLPLHEHSSSLYSKYKNDDDCKLKTYSSMGQVYRNAWKDASAALERLQHDHGGTDNRIEECLQHLDNGITYLSSILILPLNPVLLHLDLQPQNLIFYSSPQSKSRVFSVLDWEDAAWGDPRFDVMLLCRKVCANRDQADALWLECSKTASLGPIDPWLRLETVHSITTMLLQSMDLVNGGRNPWETKTDLWGKLQREFSRLDGYDERTP